MLKPFVKGSQTSLPPCSVSAAVVHPLPAVPARSQQRGRLQTALAGRPISARAAAPGSPCAESERCLISNALPRTGVLTALETYALAPAFRACPGHLQAQMADPFIHRGVGRFFRGLKLRVACKLQDAARQRDKARKLKKQLENKAARHQGFCSVGVLALDGRGV